MHHYGAAMMSFLCVFVIVLPALRHFEQSIYTCIVVWYALARPKNAHATDILYISTGIERAYRHGPETGIHRNFAPTPTRARLTRLMYVRLWARICCLYGAYIVYARRRRYAKCAKHSSSSEITEQSQPVRSSSVRCDETIDASGTRQRHRAYLTGSSVFGVQL